MGKAEDNSLSHPYTLLAFISQGRNGIESEVKLLFLSGVVKHIPAWWPCHQKGKQLLQGGVTSGPGHLPRILEEGSDANFHSKFFFFFFNQRK